MSDEERPWKHVPEKGVARASRQAATVALAARVAHPLVLRRLLVSFYSVLRVLLRTLSSTDRDADQEPGAES